MLKSIMELIDVLFPLNLSPLTYSCPTHLIDKAMPGMLVSAPLKNQTASGIVLNKSSLPSSYTLPAIRYISDIHGESPLFELPMLKLIDWMSDYYIANKGLVLKNILPKEMFKRVKSRKSSHHSPIDKGGTKGWEELMAELIDENILSRINESISKKEYKTFLLSAPTLLYEISFLAKLLQSEQNTIILAPEIIYINYIAPVIREIAGERLCILHSGLSKGQRSDAYEKIISGQCTVVLGTRTAVFTPLKNVSMIVVMQEHSSSYRTEEGLRYNARDIAVMRGYLEKTTVLLSSICPSIESIYNTKQSKYTLLMPNVVIKKPKIKIVDMRYEKQPSPNLAKTVIDAAASLIKNDGRIMFVINRKGYSMLTCRECGHTETCGKCSIPLIFHKDDKTLKCHYCGFKSHLPEHCRRCGGLDFEFAGTGIQKIEENIKKIFSKEPIRLDSDRIKSKRRLEGIAEMLRGETIILGTKLLIKRLYQPDAGGELGMAAILNTDISLNLPDFRSAEKAYQELTIIADKIKPEGKVFIQTRMPQHYLFKCIRNYDYNAFCNEELLRRKEMSYPPYSKLALISLKGKGYDNNKVNDAVEKLLEENEDLAIFGPSHSLGKRGTREYSLLFKTAAKTKLNFFVKDFLKVIERDKHLKVSVAIDP